jgi:hypothetical protein
MKTDNVLDLKELATAVYKSFFASGKPYSHILFRDYARGVIERAASAGAQLEFSLSNVRPPYDSVWPTKIPSTRDLEIKYGWRKDKMPDAEWSRIAIYSSVMGFGDFARYVIGTNSSFEWTKTRLGKRPTVTAKDRYEQFLDNLSRKQSDAWQRVQNIHWESVVGKLREGYAGSSKAKHSIKSPKDSLRRAEKAFEATLNPPELRAYRKDVLAYLSNPRSDEDRFDLRVAQRWILQRVFDLGWSVEKFGTFDRDVNAYGLGRDAKKAERIGKKYQWIAYHEFLGLVADHFEFGDPLVGDLERHYEGPWQMFVRDVDPSCALRKIPGGDKFEEAWWCPTNAYAWNDDQEGSWIARTDDLPKAAPLIEISNPEDGSKWLALEINPEWKEPIPKYETELAKRERRLWYQIRSFLVERKSAAKAFSSLSKQHFWGRWMPENPEYHTVFLGEFYWAPALRTGEPIFDPSNETPHSAKGKIPCPLTFTQGSYNAAMNSFDCSMEEEFSVYLPGAWLVNKMGLRWNGIEGHFFDSKGDLVAYDPATSLQGTHALLIRKDRFLRFLKTAGYEVIWFLLGGKQILARDFGSGNWPGELQISGVYRVKAETIAGGLRPKLITRS